RAAAGAEQAARGAAAEGGAHVRALAVLQQDEADHAQGGQHLQGQHDGQQDVHSKYSVVMVTRRASGAGRGNDLKEIRGLERSTADEATVDVRLRQQGGRIGRVHAAAVKDVHALGL